MGVTFLISLIGMALLYTTLWRYEIAAKEARIQLRRLRRATLGDEATAPLGRSAAPV